MSSRWQLFLTATVFAATLPTSAQAIHDEIGTECGSCQFPTAVRMPRCSGVYMGQGLVITAGHCIDNVIEGTSRAHFGEDDSDPAFSAVIESCTAHPDGGPDGDSYDGVDLGFCILDDSDGLPEIPIVPAMIPTGCERDWLSHQVNGLGGHPLVTSVGSGCPDYYVNGSTTCGIDGVKRYLPLQLIGQTSYNGSSTKLELERWGDLTVGILDGDSGGPVFDVMPDGTWRLIGVHHGTNVALKAGFAEAVPPYLHWIESASGRDITPCHEFSNGEWSTSGTCAGQLPKDTEEAGASWVSGCPSAMGGGNVGISTNFCPGWPSRPGDKAVGAAGGASLDPDLFLEAASLVSKPGPGQRPEAIVASVTPLSVFPFLAEQLPGTVPLSYLTDPVKLRETQSLRATRPAR